MTNIEAIPSEFKEREQWLLWHESSKAPLTEHGDTASWNDPATWLSFDRAVELMNSQERFTGIGFVIVDSDPFVGLDLDGVLREPRSEKPKDWVPGLDFISDTWAEYSYSGTGIHAFLRQDRLPEWWSNAQFDDGHKGVEAYTEKFFALTGDVIPHANEDIASPDISRFLSEAFERIEGHAPHLPGGESAPNSDADIGIYDVISRTNYPEGENKSHPFHASETGTNFRVDPGGETFRCWRHGVTGNGLHLLGMEQGEIDCGDWERGGLASDTWKRIFDAGREAGYDIPEPRAVDGGTETVREDSSPDREPETGVTWDDVYQLYASDSSGSTTRASAIAADLIDDEYYIKPIRDTGVVYFYDFSKGYYVRKGDRYLEQIIQDKLQDKWNINRARNVRKNVIARNWVSQNQFSPPPGKVCVRNGVLDLRTRTLESHSPDYYFTARLDVEYDSEAETELWDEFITDVVAQPGDVKKIEEFIGYTLQVGHHKRHKNLFIVGPTQSGKSTLADVVKGLFGDPPTVVNLTPQQIADTRFDAAALKDAMLNTVNDINATKIENSGALKRVFAGEPLKLENKHKDASFGAPKAKHLFTANWLPPIVGQDEAIWRRLLIVEFPDTVPNHKRDEDLPDKLRDELPGILNRALDGLERLEDNNSFTNDRSRDDTRRLWDSWRDAHKRFLYDTFSITGNGDQSVDKGTYYQAYKEHAVERGFEIKPKQSVTKSLKYVPEIGVRDDSYTGIKWENKGGNTSSQERLNTQEELRTSILGWINEFETPYSGATKQQIRQYAKEQSADVEKVEYLIDNLLTDGTIYESGDGLRLND